MFSSQMFDGIVRVLIMLGALIGFLLFGLPGYFYGRYHGKEAAYAEAVKQGALRIQYNPETGDKVMIWRKP